MKHLLCTVAAALSFGALATLACARDQERIKEQPADRKEAHQAGSDAIVVRVVSVADCVNTPPTITLIQETAVELGLRVDLVRQLVTTQEEASTYRFMGSPTVQIDGLDLQPEMRANTRYGFT